MRKFKLPIHDNPLKTKEDLQEAFKQLTEPLKVHYSEGCARLHVGNTSTGYTDSIAEMEGFSRILWGLAPLTAGGKDSKLWDIYVEGVKNGTNPSHEEYWGKVNDYDQRLVEMAAIGLALELVPEKLWKPLSEMEKENFANWLLQINDSKLYDCNWVLFTVMVNLGLKKVGAEYSKERMDWALDRIEEFYLGGGWYSDGKGDHSDYYVPFAIYYYTLVYAKLMGEEDPVRAKLYKERAAMFAKDFINWFDEDGSALPYGRSLTYRFAQAAFWSALVYAEVEVFTPGVIKGLILRNLRWWFKQPIFDADGILTIGYAYPNLTMAENYNSPGSPYWSFKTLLILALGENHPFWTSKEEALPQLPRVSVQEKPHLVLCRDENNRNLMAFNTGHPATNDHTHTADKYEKFVYSNTFGFSVQRAEWGLGQGAYDSMLALSEEDNIYRVKRYCKEHKIEGKVIYSKWNPWSDVEIETWVVCGNPWHVRVHSINTKRSLDAAEGGFAFGIEHMEGKRLDYDSWASDDKALIKSAYEASGIADLYGERAAQLVYPNANTNLMHSRTAIPTLTGKLKPGRSILVSAVLGRLGNTSLEEFEKNKPSVQVKENKITIVSNGEATVITV